MNNLKPLILILVGLVAILAPAHAQTFYLGAGPSLHADLPHGAVNATLGLCNADSTTCALLNYSARGTLAEFRQYKLTYSSSAGLRQVIATAHVNNHVIELFLLGNGGAAIAPTATGFSGAAGGGLTYHPAAHPNWAFSGAAQGEYSPVNPGWRPNIFVQAGYVFHGSK